MKKFLRKESGTALIEFALFVSVFVLVLAGVADYGIYIHHQMELSEAAAAGAAFGTLPGHQKDFTGMQTVAKITASDISGLTVPLPTNIYTCTPGGAVVTNVTTCPNYGTPIMYVQVTTSATVPAALKWTGISSSLQLGATATYRVPWTK